MGQVTIKKHKMMSSCPRPFVFALTSCLCPSHHPPRCLNSCLPLCHCFVRLFSAQIGLTAISNRTRCHQIGLFLPKWDSNFFLRLHPSSRPNPMNPRARHGDRWMTRAMALWAARMASASGEPRPNPIGQILAAKIQKLQPTV
jgi:hypothetical protein